MKMKRYKCIQKWARNDAGDIVQEYEFRRYPIEIRQDYFEVYEEKSKPKKPKPKKKNSSGGSSTGKTKSSTKASSVKDSQKKSDD